MKKKNRNMVHLDAKRCGSNLLQIASR